MQMGNLTRPLAGEQDHLQWCAKVGPERSDLGVTEHPLAISFTVYRCSENRCEYVDEVAAKEPAELPRGHLNQNQSVNENINSTTTDQTPKQ